MVELEKEEMDNGAVEEMEEIKQKGYLKESTKHRLPALFSNSRCHMVR